MMTQAEYAVALEHEAATRALNKRKDALVIQRWADASKTAETYEWASWTTYWKAVGATATLEVSAGRDRWTVPTQLPHEFDPTYMGML